MRSDWVRAQDHRRRSLAVLFTVGLYGLAILGLWIVSLISPFDLARSPGPVMIDLAGPEGGLALGSPSAPPRPEGQAPSPPAPPAAPATPSPAKAAAGAKVAVPAPPAAAPAVSAPASTNPGALPPEKAAAAANPTPQATAPATSRTFSSSGGSSGLPGAAGSTGAGVRGGTGSVTYHGTEMGNAIDTTFGGASGKVGRNLYAPIFMFMPLPQAISGEMYNNIPAQSPGYSAEERKKAFRDYYARTDDTWRLRKIVPVSQRNPIWEILQDAGYDPSNADFKIGRHLSPVVFDFVIGPAPDTKQPELVDLQLVSSSGYADIDEAVIYGFRHSSYFNNTGNAISGRFAYRFDEGK